MKRKLPKLKLSNSDRRSLRLTKPNGGAAQKNTDQLDIVMHLNPTEPNLKIAQNARQLLMLTNTTIPSPHLRLVCDGDMVKSSASISGASVVMGGSQVLGKRIVDVSIDSPAWTPKAPLIVTLFYNDPNQITECAIQGSLTP